MMNQEIIEVNASEPFTARNPMQGLMAWGPADSEKKIVREYSDKDGYKIVVVEFSDGEKRKVRLLENQKEV